MNKRPAGALVWIGGTEHRECYDLWPTSRCGATYETGFFGGRWRVYTRGPCSVQCARSVDIRTLRAAGCPQLRPGEKRRFRLRLVEEPPSG